ncbi:MAG: zinc ribbon domain-containing protein [Haloferacaceae archaeon]
MTEFIFQCPGCGQEIEVNGAMRESILEHGCPVCTTSPSASDFVTTVQ